MTRKRVVKRAKTATTRKTTKTGAARSRVVLVKGPSKTKSSTSPCSRLLPTHRHPRRIRQDVQLEERPEEGGVAWEVMGHGRRGRHGEDKEKEAVGKSQREEQE